MPKQIVTTGHVAIFKLNLVKGEAELDEAAYIHGCTTVGLDFSPDYSSLVSHKGCKEKQFASWYN